MQPAGCGCRLVAALAPCLAFAVAALVVALGFRSALPAAPCIPAPRAGGRGCTRGSAAPPHAALPVVVPVVVVAVLSHRAVESLGDAVGLRMPDSRADVQQVVRSDHGAQLGVAVLAAVVVHDAWLGLPHHPTDRLNLIGKILTHNLFGGRNLSAERSRCSFTGHRC